MWLGLECYDDDDNDEEDYFYLVCLGGLANLFSERLHLCRNCKVIIFESLCTSFKVSYIFESARTLPEICSSLKPNHRFSQTFFLSKRIIFPFFVVQLDHSIVNTSFSYGTDTQA